MRTLLILLFLAFATGSMMMGLADDQRPTKNSVKEHSITIKDIHAFTVIGIEARTNNVKESTADGAIPKLRQRFFSEAIPSRIPDVTGQNFYAVYSNYASDHNGDYTYMAGAQVKDGTAAPPGMVSVRIPAGKYAVFTTEKGPFAKVIPAAWQHIFQLEDQGTLKRSYLTDFEIYDERARDPQNGQIDIYIGVK